VVPSSAIKTANNVSYVEVPDETIDSSIVGSASGVVLKNKTKRQEITTGLSNDTSTEILTGLSEGDLVVVKTITATSTTKSSNSSVQSLFQMGGGNRSGTTTTTNTKTNTSK
jgi:hypothetical protein